MDWRVALYSIAIHVIYKSIYVKYDKLTSLFRIDLLSFTDRFAFLTLRIINHLLLHVFLECCLQTYTSLYVRYMQNCIQLGNVPD